MKFNGMMRSWRHLLGYLAHLFNFYNVMIHVAIAFESGGSWKREC